MKISNIQEQIKRMKSLMREERLWGNLVDKEIVSEQLLPSIRKIVKAAKASSYVPMVDITAAARLNIRNALKVVDTEARIKQFDIMLENVGKEGWKKSINSILTRIKIDGGEISVEDQIYLRRQFAVTDKIILRSLRDGDNIDGVIENVNNVAKEFGFNPLSKTDIEGMVYLLYGGDVKVLNAMGISKKIKLIPDNELIKNSEETLRAIGYTDEEIRASKAAYTKRVNNGEPATKPKTKEEIAADEAAAKKAEEKKAEEKKAADEAAAKKAEEKKAEAESGGPRGNIPIGTDPSPKLKYWWGDLKQSGGRSKNGWIFKWLSTYLYKIKIMPKSGAYIEKKVLKLAGKLASPLTGRVLVRVFKYSPAIMITMSITKLWWDKVEWYDENGDFDPHFVLGKTQKVWGSTVDIDDTFGRILGEHLYTVFTQNPLAYTAYYTFGKPIGMIISGEVENERKKMVNWVTMKHLCCPKKNASTYDEAGNRREESLDGWAEDCPDLGKDGYGCTFPDGVPSCDEVYKKIFVDKGSNGKTLAEEKMEGDMVEEYKEENPNAKKVGKALLKTAYAWAGWEWKSTDLATAVKDIMPDSEAFCTQFEKGIAFDKMAKDVKNGVEEVLSNADETLADLEILEQTPIRKMQGYCDFRGLDGELPNCDEWKTSGFGSWFTDNTKAKYEDGALGAAKCWCEYQGNKYSWSSEEISDCVDGAMASCSGTGDQTWCGDVRVKNI